MILTALSLAVRSIRRHLLRSLLTVLGVVIGVAALVTLVTVGRSVTASVTEQVSGIGSSQLTIRPIIPAGAIGMTTPRPFSISDVEAIRQDVAGVARIAPVARIGIMAHHDAGHWSTQLFGSDAAWVPIGNWTLASGRNLDAADVAAGRSVCILGATVARTLFAEPDPVGATIRIGEISCDVIGLLRAKGADGFGEDQDDLVLIPLAAMQRRITGSSDIRTIVATLDPAHDPDDVIRNLRALLRDRRHLPAGAATDFEITDPREIASALSSITGMLTALLGTIAAISLVVGGIGIMNVMLVSVTERTREIGVRLAIGAIEEEVQLQFLVEAIVLACFGGALGLLLALLLSWGITSLLGVGLLPDIRANVLAFAFAGVLGALFGFAPARRAAALDPIDALRHE